MSITFFSHAATPPLYFLPNATIPIASPLPREATVPLFDEFECFQRLIANRSNQVMRDSFALLHRDLCCWRVWTAFSVHHDRVVANNIDVLMSRSTQVLINFNSAAHRFEASFIHHMVAADTACPDDCAALISSPSPTERLQAYIL